MPANQHTGMMPPFNEEIRRFRLHRDGVEWRYGLGAAWLGRSGLAPEAIAADVAVLAQAYELGVRYFDTSAKYGDSEIIVGAFLGERPEIREHVFLATKAPIPEQLTPQEAKAFVARSIDDSLRRLQTDNIDLLQIHDIYTLDQVIGEGGALEALQEARAAGKIRYIGLGTRPLDLLQSVIACGLVDSVLTYSDYTPIDRNADALLRLGAERRAVIVNGSPLSAGMLAGADPRGLQIAEWHEESVVRRKLAAEIYDLCALHGVPVLAAALQFPLRRDEIAMNLTGPKNGEELVDTLAALRHPIPETFWQALDDWYGNRHHSNHSDHSDRN